MVLTMTRIEVCINAGVGKVKQSRPNRCKDKNLHACKSSDNDPSNMVDSALNNCDYWCRHRILSDFERIGKQMKHEKNLKIWRTGSGETVSM